MIMVSCYHDNVVIVERSASQNDVNDEINLPENECSNSVVVFLYIEGLYISKQYSSRSASSTKLSFSSRFAHGMPSGLKAVLQLL
jgi:hypothetical protein